MQQMFHMKDTMVKNPKTATCYLHSYSKKLLITTTSSSHLYWNYSTVNYSVQGFIFFSGFFFTSCLTSSFACRLKIWM